MSRTPSEKLMLYGERAYIGAWGLEIIASITGLSTGIALAFRGYSDANASNFSEMDFILASAPYFMVAIAELTKIPIVTLLFHVRWLWKPVVLVFLLGMAAITFETVYAGLDRALTLRKDRYDTLVLKIDGLKDGNTRAGHRMSELSNDDQLKQTKENYNALEAQSKIDHNLLTDQLAEVNRQIQGQRPLTPEAAQLNELISAKTTEREKLVAEKERSIKDNMDEFERQRQSFVDRIKLAQERGDTEAIKRYQSLLDALVNPRPKIEKDYSPKIDAIEKDIAKIRADPSFNQLESAPMSDADRAKLQERKERTLAQITESDSKWQALLGEANKQIEAALTLRNQAMTEINSINQQSETRGSEIEKLEKERIETARLDQIRRIAARFYGAKPEDVSNDKVDFVSNVWFGSLALLAALAGPMTALVSLELQKLAAEGIKRRGGLLRRLFVSWKWRRVRTIKVPVEVTVEKEVEKRVEVPVEKLIKEIMYVPIFTDDPEALRRAMDQSLEKDVADLLTFSLASSKNGSSAQHKVP